MKVHRITKQLIIQKNWKTEADHPPPSSAKVKNAWMYAYTPQYVFLA